MVCLSYGGMDETLWLPKTMVILKLSEMGDLHLIFVTTVTINGNASIRIATTMTTILAGLASSQASSAGLVARVMSTTKKDSPFDCNRTGHQWKVIRYLRQLPDTRSESKIVLPCKPKFPRRDKSFFQVHFAVGWISAQAIRWMRI